MYSFISGLANSILRLAADGRISLYFRPPQYSVQAGKAVNMSLLQCILDLSAEWERHPEVAEMMELQRQGLGGSKRKERELELFEDEESESADEESEGALAVQSNKFSLLVELEDD